MENLRGPGLQPISAGKFDCELQLIRPTNELRARGNRPQQRPGPDLIWSIVRPGLLPGRDDPVNVSVIDRTFGAIPRSIFFDEQIDRVPGIVISQVELDPM